MSEARERLRRDEVHRARAALPADQPPAIGDEDRVFYPLCDAVLMMFHLLSEQRDPFACRDLRNAVRRAANAEPMAEAVEIRASTWAAIKGIGFLPARLASRRRFDEAFDDED